MGVQGKYVTITGGYARTANRKLVWTGRHNFTHNALVCHDETCLLIDDRDVHDAFVDNWLRARLSHCRNGAMVAPAPSERV